MYTLTCFKKLLVSPAFWATVLGTTVICMFSELYRDPQSGSAKTVIEMYLQYTRNAFLADPKLCSYSVFKTGFGGWLTMFAPVLVSLSSVGICADELKSGMWRFTLHRIGSARYSIGSCAFILLSGGLTLTLGYGLFGIFSAVMFPPLSAYPAESVSLFTETTFFRESAMSSIYQIGGFPLCTAAQLAETFFYGVVCSAAAMLLSAVSENKYVVICTPFFLKYGLNQLSTVLSYKAIEDPMNFNENLLKFANTINPDAASSFLSSSENTLGIIVVNTAFVICLSVLFCVIRIRRSKNET